MNERPGEIKAQIIERDGKILMVKECPIHGKFEDVMAIDAAFFKHLEEVFPGRDIRAHNDEDLHNHGSSTITHGRGSVLTIDLTNRCNMMCDPCFMDANQVGFVHELTWDDIKTMLDNALTIKPRRQMSVQFSGGEPTLSPVLPGRGSLLQEGRLQLGAGGHQRHRVRQDPRNSRMQAAEAGLRYAYLQFDGIGNAANSHRAVGNLFDVKLRAIENLHSAGVDIVPVITIINGINNEQVGRIIQFALDNPKKISLPQLPAGVVHGPRRSGHRRPPRGAALHAVAPGARREEPDRASASRRATGFRSRSCRRSPTGPTWCTVRRPIGAQLSCGCHPNCGVGMAVMVDKETKEAVPGDRVPERRPAGARTSRGSTTPPAAGSCRWSAWRWR